MGHKDGTLSVCIHRPFQFCRENDHKFVQSLQSINIGSRHIDVRDLDALKCYLQKGGNCVRFDGVLLGIWGLPGVCILNGAKDVYLQHQYPSPTVPLRCFSIDAAAACGSGCGDPFEHIWK